MNSTTRSQKVNVQPVVISDDIEPDWETPINTAKMVSHELDNTKKDILSTFREE